MCILEGSEEGDFVGAENEKYALGVFVGIPDGLSVGLALGMPEGKSV